MQTLVFEMFGICGLLVQTVVLRYMLMWFGETRVLVVGLISSGLEMLVMAWIKVKWQVHFLLHVRVLVLFSCILFSKFFGFSRIAMCMDACVPAMLLIGARVIGDVDQCQEAGALAFHATYTINNLQRTMAGAGCVVRSTNTVFVTIYSHSELERQLHLHLLRMCGAIATVSLNQPTPAYVGCRLLEPLL